MKFYRDCDWPDGDYPMACDNFGEYPPFVYLSEGDDDDFSFLPGEGYRIVVNGDIDDPNDLNDFLLPLIAESAPQAITLYGAGEELPGSEGTSNSGMNHYCAPYDASTRTAVNFRDELNAVGCPGGGSCVSDVCSGGTRDGLDCTPFVSISKYLIESDSLQTYAGVLPGNDFPLKSGEAYLVQVADSVTWTPATLTTGDVELQIVERRPGACAPQDGGVVVVSHGGVGYDVGISWEHDLYSNLVFVSQGPGSSVPLSNYTGCEGDGGYCASDVCVDGPRDGLPCVAQCSTGQIPNGWKGLVCSPPTGFDPGGECNDADLINIHTRCGCEIRGPVTSTALDVGLQYCVNVGCGNGTYDCDNTNTADCTDPNVVFCNELEAGYTFFLSQVSFDAGATWLDNATEVGLSLPVSIQQTNCCQAVCSGDPETTCTTDDDCDGEDTCVLVLPYECTDSFWEPES